MPPGTRDRSLQAILHAYLQARDRGEMPDRQAILDAHPDLRDELAEYFGDASRLDAIAKSLKTQTLGSYGAASPSLGKVRYFGDYELLEEIARGGMGVVFRAKQVSLNRVVALKMILKGELAGEADVRRFRQEAEAAANLDHRNIVPIYEVGEHEGQQYFSMKLISVVASDEWRVTSKEGQRKVAEVVAKVARAVHHAHQRGILHRDLKPSNILIDVNGEPHVADFGLAKKVEGGDDATKSGAIVGTPAYMAPEQARAEKSLTTAVDVYSLGAILYTWLSGRPPFVGGDVLSTLMKVAEDEPVRPRAVNAKVDRDLETICLKCLEKDPARRYGSAEALADDLERWLRSEPIVARRSSLSERLVKWARREPGAAVFVSFGILWVAIFLTTLIVMLMKIDASLDAELVAKNEAVEASTKAQIRALEAQASQKREAGERKRAESERDAKDKALRNADALRLVALSQVAITNNPAKALTLAVQGAERAIDRDASHNNAIATAFQQLHEIRRFDAPSVPASTQMTPTLAFTSLAYSPNGKYLAATTGRATLSGHFVAGNSSSSYAMVWERVTGKLAGKFQVPGILTVGVVFSPDNQKLVTLHEGYAAIRFEGDNRSVLYSEQAARLWDVATGKELHVFGGHSERVTFAKFSNDGKHIATGGWDDTVRIWNVATGKLIHALKTGQGSVRHVHFSGDSTRLLVVNKGWQYRSSAENDPGEKKFVPKVRNPLTRPGSKFADLRYYVGVSMTGIGLGNTNDPLPAQLWKVKTGTKISEFRMPPNSEERVGPTVDACFESLGADNKRIITGHWNQHVRLWDAETGKHLKTMTTTIPNIYRLRPGIGEVYVLGASSEVARFSLTDGYETRRWQAFDEGFSAIRWHAGHPLVLFVQGPEPEDRSLNWLNDYQRGEPVVPPRHSVSVHSLLEGRRYAFLQGHEDTILDAQFDPSGNEVATASLDGTVRLWSLKSNILASQSRHGKIYSIAFHPDGNSAYSASHDGKVYKSTIRSLEPLKTFDHSGIEPGNHLYRKPVMQVEVSPDGQRMVSLVGDYFVVRTFDKSQKPDPKVPFEPVKIWDAASGKLQHALQGFTARVRSVAFSPNGQRLLTVNEGISRFVFINEKGEHRGTRGGSGKDLGVRIWNPLDGKMIASLPVESYCRAAVWSPDSEKIATTDPLKIWDSRTQKEVLTLDKHRVDQLLWSNDGRWIVGWRKFIIANRSVVVVWDAQTGKTRHLFDQHAGDVLAVALAKFENRLAVATAEGKVHVWELESGKQKAVQTGFKASITTVALSRSGRWLAAGTENGDVQIRDTSRGCEWLNFSLKGEIRVLEFSQDERWLALGNGSLHLWPTDPLEVARKLTVTSGQLE